MARLDTRLHKLLINRLGIVLGRVLLLERNELVHVPERLDQAGIRVVPLSLIREHVLGKL